MCQRSPWSKIELQCSIGWFLTSNLIARAVAECRAIPHRLNNLCFQCFTRRCDWVVIKHGSQQCQAVCTKTIRYRVVVWFRVLPTADSLMSVRHPIDVMTSYHWSQAGQSSPANNNNEGSFNEKSMICNAKFIISTQNSHLGADDCAIVPVAM